MYMLSNLNRSFLSQVKLYCYRKMGSSTSTDEKKTVDLTGTVNNNVLVNNEITADHFEVIIILLAIIVVLKVVEFCYFIYYKHKKQLKKRYGNNNNGTN